MTMLSKATCKVFYRLVLVLAVASCSDPRQVTAGDPAIRDLYVPKSARVSLTASNSVPLPGLKLQNAADVVAIHEAISKLYATEPHSQSFEVLEAFRLILASSSGGPIQPVQAPKWADIAVTFDEQRYRQDVTLGGDTITSIRTPHSDVIIRGDGGQITHLPPGADRQVKLDAGHLFSRSIRLFAQDWKLVNQTPHRLYKCERPSDKAVLYLLVGYGQDELLARFTETNGTISQVALHFGRIDHKTLFIDCEIPQLTLELKGRQPDSGTELQWRLTAYRVQSAEFAIPIDNEVFDVDLAPGQVYVSPNSGDPGFSATRASHAATDLQMSKPGMANLSQTTENTGAGWLSRYRLVLGFAALGAIITAAAFWFSRV